MERIITVIAHFVLAARQAYAKKGLFLVLAVLVFLGSLYLLAKADLLPEVRVAVAEPVVTLATSAVASTTVSAVPVAEAPVHIAIETIGLTATIANPSTTDIKTLDEELLKGAVRYPTSARLGEEGNVVLFGHSSYLPVVGNQAYKTFNGIQKLVAGDTIVVSSADTAYTYKVRTVEKESAETAGISLATSGRVLTLATCNSFGTKSDRFVVTADFVESHSLATK